MGATDEEKAEAAADVDDEFVGRQQQMETAIIQVSGVFSGLLAVYRDVHVPALPERDLKEKSLNLRLA